VSEEKILAGLKEREKLGSTGFGKGIAIPHCRVESVTDFVVGLITVPERVDFDSVDGEEVRLIVFIVAPEGQSEKHIKLLSTISQTLLISGVVKEILAAKNAEIAVESFLRHTRADISTEGGTEKVMFHILIQDEDLFRQIIQVLAGIESSSVVVIDTTNTRTYLAKVPLFAGFWRDEPKGFSRLIVMIVDKKLTNETLRRIESVTGNLNERSGVMVTVQQLSYAAGSLNGE